MGNYQCQVSSRTVSCRGQRTHLIQLRYRTSTRSKHLCQTPHQGSSPIAFSPLGPPLTQLMARGVPAKAKDLSPTQATDKGNLLIPPGPKETRRGFLVVEGLASSHSLGVLAAAFVVHKAREERPRAGRGCGRVRGSLGSKPRQILHLATRGSERAYPSIRGNRITTDIIRGRSYRPEAPVDNGRLGLVDGRLGWSYFWRLVLRCHIVQLLAD